MGSRSAAVLGVLLAVAGCSAGERGPAPVPVAESEVREPVRVLSHCGVRWMQWQGRSWTAENPQPEPAPLPDPAGGTVTVDGYTTGVVTRTGPDSLIFTAPNLAGPVRFRPGPAPPPCL
ncbi:hypothetical protein WIS52_21960 [Pseudonocardia nematodicida]|uniref:Lipoprotein n=1 Tax=Pseudonocardia nematodicida TaxID=1206997 RepID=A0ABV1KIH0_9PSEU